jgi:hypothetical protein
MDRFREVSADDQKKLLDELRELMTIGDRCSLSKTQIDELLSYLPANFFKAMMKAKIREMRKLREKILSANVPPREMGVKLADKLLEGSAGLEDAQTAMQLFPAVWYFAYLRVKANDRHMADKMVYNNSKPFSV